MNKLISIEKDKEININVNNGYLWITVFQVTFYFLCTSRFFKVSTMLTGCF